MAELLAIYRQNPNALLWAGGTAIGGLRKNDPQYARPKKIISLAMVSEIAKVSRTERYLEIGAAVPYNKILQVGQHVLPSARGFRSFVPCP
jgi:xanthine dehydrogenase iron-sulfur cluster and FAD-binding subunit A